MIVTDGIGKFELKKEYLSDWTRLLNDPNLSDGKACLGEAMKILPSKTSGIYFWVMCWGGKLYSIYIGRSEDLTGRLKNYVSVFQSKHPSNFKIRFFHDLIKHENSGMLGATLDLYFIEKNKDDLKNEEKKYIKQFDPLINLRGIPEELKQENFDANRSLYASIFKKRLSA